MLDIDRPRDSDIHTIADFAELLCLLNIDRICSRETISDHILGTGSPRGSVPSGLELDDCFGHLEWRVNAFGADYPFAFSTPGRVISAPEDLTPRQKLYAFLLLCSNLPFTSRPYNPLTDAFERISIRVLKNVWPVGGMVKAFGKNEAEYAGAKWERINALAKDIGAHPGCHEGSFRDRDTGDGGIDLAAWLRLDSFEKRNIPSALGQCACSRDQWPKKQAEISCDVLGNNIRPSHRWMQLMFIPHCFRNNRGDWAFDGEVTMSVVFDRLRIMSQLPGDVDWDGIAPPQVFNDFLDFRFDLV